MADQKAIAVVEGEKGKAEVYEIFASGKPMQYEVRFNGQSQIYNSLGEAYIEAGEKSGTKT